MYHNGLNTYTYINVFNQTAGIVDFREHFSPTHMLIVLVNTGNAHALATPPRPVIMHARVLLGLLSEKFAKVEGHCNMCTKFNYIVPIYKFAFKFSNV